MNRTIEIRDDFVTGGAIVKSGKGWVTIILGKGSTETEITFFNAQVNIEYQDFNNKFEVEELNSDVAFEKFNEFLNSLE